MSRKTLIFDFDGTLSDSLDLMLDIAHKLTNKPQLKNKADIERFRDLSLIKAVSELQIPKRLWPILLIKGRKMMADRLVELKLFDGIPEMIKKFNQQKFDMYIVSSNNKKTIMTILEKYKLSQYFINVYGGIGLLGKAKALGFIIKQVGLSPENVIYIGDETRDISAAHKNHIKSIGVSWGFMSKKNLQTENPWEIVDNVNQLIQSVETWSKTKD